jgi:RNA polymerase sigma-70 factor (ECF subfamily)
LTASKVDDLQRRPLGRRRAGCDATPVVPDDPRPLDPGVLGDHVDRLFRAAWALCGSRDDAEDLVQETYARVLARPRRVDPQGVLPYLLVTLRHTYVSGRRTAARRPATTPLPDDVEPADPRAALRPEEAASAREVFAHIAALPAHFRDALVAVDVAGLSYAEAGRLLDAPEATVASRLHRARAQVAARMDPARAGVRKG